MSDGVTNGQPPSALPPMATRHVRLRHLAERDSGFLYDLMTSPLSGGRVRFGGGTPSPDKVRASLWDSVLAQFVVEGVDSGEPLGLVAITSPNFRDGFAYMSALGQPEARGRGLVMEGVFLGVHYAFLTWPFRKLYMEASEESHRAFGSGLDVFFAEEGRLRQHTFWNGRWTDVVILAVYRQVWVRHADRLLDRFLGEPLPAHGDDRIGATHRPRGDQITR